MPPADNKKTPVLPVGLSSFIGRRREVQEVKGLLARARLVTVTGAGGVGKTRLVLQAAADALRGFGGRVWFVDLTQLHDPVLLGSELHERDVLAYLVLATIGVHQQGGEPAVGQLIAHLADRPSLLILDNCEHLIRACAQLVDAVLRACPATRVLASAPRSSAAPPPTSRPG